MKDTLFDEKIQEAFILHQEMLMKKRTMVIAQPSTGIWSASRILRSAVGKSGLTTC